MAWTDATRAQYSRPHDDRQNDLTDAERVLIAPLTPPQDRPADAIRSMLSSGGLVCSADQP